MNSTQMISEKQKAGGPGVSLSIIGSPVNTEPPSPTHRGSRHLCSLMPEKWNCLLPRDCSISLMAEPRDSLRTSLGAGHSSRVDWQRNPWQSVPDSQQSGIVWHTCRTMLNSWCLGEMLPMWGQVTRTMGLEPDDPGLDFCLCKGLVWPSVDMEISETLFCKKKKDIHCIKLPAIVLPDKHRSVNYTSINLR